MVSYKEVQSLAGYTTLINEMDEVLRDLGEGKYRRIMVTNTKEEGKDQITQKKDTIQSTRGGAKIIRSD